MRITVALAAVWLALCLAAPASAGPASAPAPSDEARIRAVIARWYAELGRKGEGRLSTVTAPGFIEAARTYTYVDNGSAALGPRIHTSLAATALRFAYEIDVLRIDPNFARAEVWERGYFYAAAAQKTYERAAATRFVLERQPDGQWRILAHDSGSYGIPPTKVTNPMPDLRALYYATEGKGRDPEADAREAGKF